MPKSALDMVAAAKAVVPEISPDEVKALAGRDDVVIVDVREPEEIAAGGKVAGAIHVPRGMLEFRADDALPIHDPRLARDKTVILYCGTGARSALGGKALQELGYNDVRNLGAFEDWVAAGGAVET